MKKPAAKLGGGLWVDLAPIYDGPMGIEKSKRSAIS
jgi:hypothetical protein